MDTPLVLASASPQRRTLLEELGVRFDLVPSMVDEALCQERDPAKRAVVLAERKARDVSAHRAEAWVIGCDTLVLAPDGTLLEKPKDAEQARRMIELQSGGTSLVYSGLTLRSPEGKEWTGLSTSEVTFKKLTADEVTWWVERKLWEGRSGGFQIDGLGQLLIQEIRGDWTSIVGLPVFLLGELMKKARAPFLKH